jgi:hypothetical protein
MVETGGSSKVAEDFLKFGQQLERFRKQYPAEYKIRFYMDQAQQQLEITQDEKKRADMRKMIFEGEIALNAVKAKDVDSLLEHYESIHRYKLKYNMRAYKSAGVSAKQREIAQLERRPGLPKRTVMLAMDHGCITAKEVRNFLFNNRELNDKWGNIGIDPNEDDFEITDYDNKNKAGDCPTKKLTSCRIPKIISELRPSD